MKETESKQGLLDDLTGAGLFGLALCLTGIEETLRSIWRLVDGEEAFVALLVSISVLIAGICLLRKYKKQ